MKKEISQNNSKVKPNLFIVGAPKCGTTSLANWLAGHPEVFFSPVKEPHYFNTDGLRAVRTRVEYERLFKSVKDEKVIAEGSTHYLFSKHAIKNIKNYQPRAKFIVCLRNPIQMAQSLHAERLSQGRENIGSFGKAWALQSERRVGRHIPYALRDDPERLQYGEYCKLGEQVKRLLQDVPREQVLFVFLDDLASNPDREGEKILQFLNVDTNYDAKMPNSNSSKYTRSPRLLSFFRYFAQLKNKLGLKGHTGWYSFIKNRLVSNQARQNISPSLRNEMVQFFEQDISLLSKLTGKDLSYWLE